MSFTEEERADLIAALSKTVEMVGLLLDALDVLMFICRRRAAEYRRCRALQERSVL